MRAMSLESTQVPSHVVSIDFSLPYLIRATGIQAPNAKRRIWAIHNTIAALAGRWRPKLPLDAVQELRLCESTCLALLDWMDIEHTDDPVALDLLTVYASGVLTDEGIPLGWVRLLVKSGTAPASLLTPLVEGGTPT